MPLKNTKSRRQCWAFYCK